ncbi:hypothetical protein [Bradyrhizobium sp. RDT46]|uniref:hypothetical protein n=1 Tax=Bradyrhizobium sp. RDT46 TaxID=3341829 RepID=UPI0035C6CDF3
MARKTETPATNRQPIDFKAISSVCFDMEGDIGLIADFSMILAQLSAHPDMQGTGFEDGINRLAWQMHAAGKSIEDKMAEIRKMLRLHTTVEAAE